jgi:hypothetical protein
MTATIRRILLTISVAAGLVAAAAGPAAAGINLGNHCEPLNRPAAG